MLIYCSLGCTHWWAAVQESSELHEAALAQWNVTYKRLQGLLRAGVDLAVQRGRLPPQARDKYFMSGVNHRYRSCNAITVLD